MSYYGIEWDVILLVEEGLLNIDCKSQFYDWNICCLGDCYVYLRNVITNDFKWIFQY